MRITTRVGFVLIALVLASQPLRAQGVDLTDDRTAEQKWTRVISLSDFMNISFLAYAKSLGQTHEQWAEFLIDIGAPTWGAPGTGTVAGLVRGMFRNYNLYPNLEFEILSESESEIRGRMNIPPPTEFGETGEAYGVTLREFREVLTLFYEGVADYKGLDMTHEFQDDWIYFTMTSR